MRTSVLSCKLSWVLQNDGSFCRRRVLQDRRFQVVALECNGFGRCSSLRSVWCGSRFAHPVFPRVCSFILRILTISSAQNSQKSPLQAASTQLAKRRMCSSLGQQAYTFKFDSGSLGSTGQTALIRFLYEEGTIVALNVGQSFNL